MKAPAHLFDRESYFYKLPEALIAQRPCEPRDQARLMVIDRRRGTIHHDIFKNLNDHLPAHSQLVINNSRVVPARLLAQRNSGGAVECFLLNPKDDSSSWEVLLKPLKKIREGEEINFGFGLKGVLEYKEQRIMRFNKRNVVRYLEKLGHIPLPPYIKRPDTPQDRRDYQTVYAKRNGSVASPTAGLHFTDTLITRLKQQGHRFHELTLHINYGTFKPVECTDIREHPMHTESYLIRPSIWQGLVKGKQAQKPVTAVGTTSCRVLEAALQSGVHQGSTDIFIYPGYKFQMIDHLITNFHLPYSTLLMLVCAFGGYELVMKAYKQGIEKHYRFYSYGDAMLIL